MGNECGVVCESTCLQTSCKVKKDRYLLFYSVGVGATCFSLEGVRVACSLDIAVRPVIGTFLKGMDGCFSTNVTVGALPGDRVGTVARLC